MIMLFEEEEKGYGKLKMALFPHYKNLCYYINDTEDMTILDNLSGPEKLPFWSFHVLMPKDIRDCAKKSDTLEEALKHQVPVLADYILAKAFARLA